ncbi:MAG: sulfatase [Bryobacterales bacterium]|nr:sulfatase [Bryobacterales bacterium]
MFTRRAFLSALPLVSAAQRTSSNLLLIAVDDLNRDLGCYGHPIVRTPNLDSLAKSGMRFDRAFCQYPVCNPSRTSLLSGLYPETTKILDNRDNPRSHLQGHPFLPELLRANGYQTYRVGKIFHDGMDSEADWDGQFNPRPQIPPGEGRNLTGGKFAFFQWRAAEGTDTDHPDGGIAEESSKLLEKFASNPTGKPFFLAAGFRKPHDPYIAPKRYFDLYPPSSIPVRKEPRDDEADIPKAAYPPVRHNLGAQEELEYRRAYWACISFMDAQVGRLLGTLRRTGLDKSTLVIFFGDHGLHLGEHNWWNKVTLFERSARVPFLASGPGVRADSLCKQPVELLDIYPTFLQQAGTKLPASARSLHGEPLQRLFADPRATWQKAAYTVVTRAGGLGRSVQTARYRYTEWNGGADGVELYDHDNDAGEFTNLAHRESAAAVRTQLKKLLDQKRRQAGG